MLDKAIVLNKIYKKYNNDYILKDISLSFKTRETVAVIGPSGSGKSTLLKCMSFLEEVTDGQILISEKPVNYHSYSYSSFRIGMVFQNFNLFPHMSVIENLLYSPVKVLKLKPDACKEKARYFLCKFNLTDKINTKPNKLSGGQKQKVAIARTLMMNPKIVLFDEPTSALDFEVIQDIIGIISDLKKYLTIIIVTHHLRFARIIADRIIFIENGQVIEDRSTDRFFLEPESYRAKIFLKNIINLI